jgi:HEPN domain-containing protein
MNNVTLAESYLTKARVRLKVLELLLKEEAYSDVVREAQEAVELAAKAILRQIGVEPPKQHDVGHLIVEYKDLLPEDVSLQAEELASISKWLRKEREFAFYGDIDFIPTSEYKKTDAERALQDARVVVGAAQRVIEGG